MPSITSSLNGPSTQAPRNRLLWLAFGALAVAQLFALGVLCSQQVRKAEARDSHYVVQRMALTDCLQYVPGSTIASCNQRLDLVRASAQPTQEASAAQAVPVSFNYR